MTCPPPRTRGPFGPAMRGGGRWVPGSRAALPTPGPGPSRERLPPPEPDRGDSPRSLRMRAEDSGGSNTSRFREGESTPGSCSKVGIDGRERG